METYSSKTSRSRTPLRTILWATSGAFLLGASMVGYIAYRMDGNWDTIIKSAPDTEVSKVLDGKGLPSPTPNTSPSPTETSAETEAAEQATEAVERVEEQQGGLDQRLAAAEQRLAQLDLQTQAATGNAARAEGLLIAFATRRTMERGAELGYLADQLRIRFSDALPNAVNTVIATSRDPITLDELLARLEGLGPALSNSKEEPSLKRFQRELSELFIIRRESSPSPQPERRLDRARYFLESGRVSAAIEEVKKLPGAAQAAPWIRDAERYAAAQQALDLIETSAVLERRRLRDGEGNRVQQASPAEAGN
jgi:hypothetical protein